MLLLGGHLRPMMHVTMATMIMYYHVRYAHDEMLTVLAHMREAFVAAFGSPPLTSGNDHAHAKLIEWGDIIKTQFDLDNLHLTGICKVISRKLGPHPPLMTCPTIAVTAFRAPPRYPM